MNGILRDFAEYMNNLGETNQRGKTIEVGENTFAPTSLGLKQVWPDPLPPQEPIVSTFQTGTLSSGLDLVKAGLEHLNTEDLLIHIAGPGSVSIVTKQSDQWKRRITLVKIDLPAYTPFPFDKYLDHEDFNIKLQQNFVPIASAAAVEGEKATTSDWAYVVQIASTVTANAVTQSENDGVGQQVTVKKTINSGLKDFAELRRIVSLAPYRTFMEVPQPVSQFIFRAKDAGEGKIPGLALFECDGGMWRKIAIGEIKRYLENQMAERDIKIPIIA